MSAEPATEVIADVIEDQAEVVGEFVRNLSRIKVRYTLLGLAAGAAAGAFAGYKLAYARAETKFSQMADDEVASMREHYQEKARALEAKAAKQPLEDLVKAQGYSTEETGPPMAVQPPEAVVEAAAEAEDTKDPRKAPNDPEDNPYSPGTVSQSVEEHLEEFRQKNMARDPQLRNVFEDRQLPEDNWDWHRERASRSPLRPYVIHVDERNEHSYSDTTLTYYEIDDVLCNEKDEVISVGRERDELIGADSLNKFGHGSEDPDIVYVRNDRLELDLEIVRSDNSYAQEVHGFDPPESEMQHGDRRRGRPRFDDE